MGFTDSIKASWDKMQTQAKELHVSIKVTSGKNYLGLGLMSDTAMIRQNAEGKIYFDKVDGFFEITDYQWEGPRYKVVSTTNTVEEKKGKEKTKKKGGLGGAAIGTLIAPGVGTMIGYAASRKKETTVKGATEANTTVNEEEVETTSNAKMTLRNLATKESFVIGFLCDSTIDGELANFNISRSRTATVEEVGQQKSKVELMKDYKELLDAQIITQEEFDAKKKELLGI